MDEVIKIIQQIKNSPELTMDQQVFNNIIKGCCKNKDLKNAIQFYHMMKSENLMPNRTTYNILMNASIQNKDMK